MKNSRGEKSVEKTEKYLSIAHSFESSTHHKPYTQQKHKEGGDEVSAKYHIKNPSIFSDTHQTSIIPNSLKLLLTHGSKKERIKNSLLPLVSIFHLRVSF